MARTTARVLVVDPDSRARTVVTWQLEAAGYTVAVVADGRDALAESAQSAPQLMIVDRDAAGLPGLDVLRRVRDGSAGLDADLPVIVTSARGSGSERIAVLDQGADDYLIKPVVPEELEARVRSLLRRTRPPDASGRSLEGPEIVLGDLCVDPAARRVTVAGRRVELTAREFDLLHFLARHPGEIFSRAQLLRLVWRRDRGDAADATVTEHVHRLRSKLEDRAGGRTLLRTVRGIGYRLETDPEAS